MPRKQIILQYTTLGVANIFDNFPVLLLLSSQINVDLPKQKY
jgi:hypothetical protein